VATTTSRRREICGVCGTVLFSSSRRVGARTLPRAPRGGRRPPRGWDPPIARCRSPWPSSPR
jgi:hypothetical protein